MIFIKKKIGSDEGDDLVNKENLAISFYQFRYLLIPKNRELENENPHIHKENKSLREEAFHLKLGNLPGNSWQDQKLIFSLIDRDNSCFLFSSKPIVDNDRFRNNPNLENFLKPRKVFIDTNPDSHFIWIEEFPNDSENIIFRNELFKFYTDTLQIICENDLYDLVINSVFDGLTPIEELIDKKNEFSQIILNICSSNLSDISEILDEEIIKILDLSNSNNGSFVFTSSKDSSLNISVITMKLNSVFLAISKGGGVIVLKIRNTTKSINSRIFARKKFVDLQHENLSVKALKEKLK